MKRAMICLLPGLLTGAVEDRAQSFSKEGGFTLPLPIHDGQLKWNATGFSAVQTSAKPNSSEIGVQARNGSAQYTLLGFLFLFPEQAPMTSAKCRDGVMEPAKKSNPTLTIAGTSQMSRSDGPPVELVGYVAQGRDGKSVYSVRGFLAQGDLCGDLEIYGNDVSVISDPNLKKIWGSYRLDPQYVPQFDDVFVYAQTLYQNHLYQAAAPMFEQALTKLPDGKDQVTWRRAWRRTKPGWRMECQGTFPRLVQFSMRRSRETLTTP